MQPLRRFTRRLLLILVLGYLGTLLLITCAQRRLLYARQTASEPHLLAAAKDENLQPWRDPAGHIIGWRTAKSPAPNRLLIFHGNAGYAAHRRYLTEGFRQLDNGNLWEVCVFEYPGYGARPGTPTQSTILAAARAAYDQLAAEDPRPIYLLGESLGTGVCCALAASIPDKISGLTLITPYTTMGDVAAKAYWYLPARLILLDPWNSAAALPKFHGPVAVLIAGQDELIGPEQGRQMFALANQPKWMWEDPAAGHNTFNYNPKADWWKKASDFLLHPNEPARPTAPHE